MIHCVSGPHSEIETKYVTIDEGEAECCSCPLEMAPPIDSSPLQPLGTFQTLFSSSLNLVKPSREDLGKF